MLSAYITQLTQQRQSQRRENRLRTTTTRFDRREERSLKNYTIIQSKVENNVPDGILRELVEFIETTNLIQSSQSNMYNGISRKQCLYFALFYMIDHKSSYLATSNLRSTFDIDKNAISRILDRLTPGIDAFVDSKIIVPSSETLLNIARRNASETFQRTHGILDGVDFKIKYLKRDFTALFPDSFRSKKFKFKNALRFQVLLSHDKQVIWTDKGNGAGTHDMRCVFRSNLHQVTTGMSIMADTAYINTYHPTHFITKYKKPNNRELNLMELNYNHAHSSERSKVERYFGLLKVRFSFLLDGYRGPIRQFYRLFRLACVIMNIVFATNSVREEEEPLIEFVIRTQVRWTSTEELRLVNNSIADTFPEVRISDTGEHSIVFDAEREETSFQGRNRRVRNIQPAFEYQGPHLPPSQRGSNRIERVLVRTREEYEQGNNDQLDQRPQNRRRITNLNDLLN